MSDHIDSFVKAFNNEDGAGTFQYNNTTQRLTYAKDNKGMSIVVPRGTSPTLARFIILYLVAKVALDEDQHLNNKSEVLGYFFAGGGRRQ
jgi:hypothetical protein